jgi:hypothetical protein
LAAAASSGALIRTLRAFSHCQYLQQTRKKEPGKEREGAEEARGNAFRLNASDCYYYYL